MSFFKNMKQSLGTHSVFVYECKAILGALVSYFVKNLKQSQVTISFSKEFETNSGGPSFFFFKNVKQSQGHWRLFMKKNVEQSRGTLASLF